jgi:intein/homing endonuclease
LASDTKILVLNKNDAHFVPKTLSELADIRSFNVLAADPRWLARGWLKTEPKKAIITYAGKKAVKRLETEDGRKVSGSDGHKLYVQRGNKILKLTIGEIEIGDELVCLPR